MQRQPMLVLAQWSGRLTVVRGNDWARLRAKHRRITGEPSLPKFAKQPEKRRQVIPLKRLPKQVMRHPTPTPGQNRLTLKA
jgi:hypothetical protein